ncbi:MAG TPA: hypothetical protein VIU62_23265 [Chloroflexota bacterium]|jgi:hypothetical protein
MHEHSWYFTMQPARWTASCACGLVVAVTTKGPGQSTWEWALDGDVPPADVMLDGIGSVTRARRELLASRTPGRN